MFVRGVNYAHMFWLFYIYKICHGNNLFHLIFGYMLGISYPKYAV